LEGVLLYEDSDRLAANIQQVDTRVLVEWVKLHTRNGKLHRHKL